MNIINVKYPIRNQKVLLQFQPFQHFCIRYFLFLIPYFFEFVKLIFVYKE